MRVQGLGRPAGAPSWREATAARNASGGGVEVRVAVRRGAMAASLLRLARVAALEVRHLPRSPHSLP